VKLYVGTSGYAYKEWKGSFYPGDMPPKEMLPFYGRRFNAVEINNTFYRMPGVELLRGWADRVPEEFVFAMKAPRIITHVKHLKHAEKETEHLLATAAVLGSKRGPLLFQLPPTLGIDISRLEAFLKVLSPDTAATMTAFEFRHPSWFSPEVFGLLREWQCALCVSDRDPAAPPPDLVRTAPWGYLRLRRPGYSDADLALWHEKVVGQGWEAAYIFFKHEDRAEGPALARRFLDLACL
jgi:uncharacterized protein YecE (DUF72 family)